MISVSIGRMTSTSVLIRFLLLIWAIVSLITANYNCNYKNSGVNRDDVGWYYHVAVDAFAVAGFNSIPERSSMTTGTTDYDKTAAATSRTTTITSSRLTATRAPSRFLDNVDGPLYVNDKCINCAACSMFSPSVFARADVSNGNDNDNHHIVSKQPSSEKEIEESRAALAACPVAAIRVEQKQKQQQQQHDQPTKVVSNDDDDGAKKEDPLVDVRTQYAINPKFNGRSLPFPRPVSPSLSDVYFVGHHNSKSFGAAPYLVSTSSYSSSYSSSSSSSSSSSTTTTIPTWIMIDTPKYSESAVRAVESVTGPNGPSYLVLTHVDDTADHNRWKERYPHLKRVFHAGDLGVHNWIGDETLEDVEILLKSQSSDRRLQFFDLNGHLIDNDSSNDGRDHDHDVVLVHTPGHSPGSIALLKRPTTVTSSIDSDSDSDISPGVLFSGDTYSYTTREGGHMSGFPIFGNDPRLQSKILPLLLDLDWQILAPGHGHVRDYTMMQHHQQQQEELKDADDANIREAEMVAAIEELSRYYS